MLIIIIIYSLALSLHDALGQLNIVPPSSVQLSIVPPSSPPAHSLSKRLTMKAVKSLPPAHSWIEKAKPIQTDDHGHVNKSISFRRDYHQISLPVINPCQQQFRVSVYKGDTLTYSSNGGVNSNNNNFNNANTNFGVRYGGANFNNYNNNNNNFAGYYQPKSGCPYGNSNNQNNNNNIGPAKPNGYFQPYGKRPDPIGECRDAHPLCCFWATLGQCDANVFWMRPNCQFACGTCGCVRENALNCVVKLGNCGTTKSPFTTPKPVTTPTAATTTKKTTTATIKTTATQKATTTAKITKPVVTTIIATPVVTKPDILVKTTSTTAKVQPTTNPASTKVPDSCEDSHDLCCFWASLEQCDMNPYWMRPNCQKACGTCGCTSKTAQSCQVKLGSCGPIGPPYKAKTTTTTTTEAATKAPMTTKTSSIVPSKPSPAPSPSSTTFSLPGDCEDVNELCCYWASLGHCDMNVFWMRPNCQKACGTCGCTHEEADTCKVNVDEACVQEQKPLTPGYVAPTEATTQAPVKPTGYVAPTETTAGPSYVAPTVATDAPPKITGYIAPTNYVGPEEPATKIPTYIQPRPEPEPDNIGPGYQPLAGKPEPSAGGCVDQSELCCFWASLGHCDSNMFWMRPNCQQACGTCGCTFDNVLDCKPTGSECIAPTPLSPSPDTQGYMGLKPDPGPAPKPATYEQKPKPTDPPRTAAPPPPTAAKFIGQKPTAGECKDENELCCFWASIGHCDLNKYWMRPHCPEACGTCGCTIDNADDCRVNIPDGCVAKPQEAAVPTTPTSPPTTITVFVDLSAGGDGTQVDAGNMPGPPAPNDEIVPPAATNALEKPTTAVLPVNPPLDDLASGEMDASGGTGTASESGSEYQSYDYATDEPSSPPTLDPAIPPPKPILPAGPGSPGLYGTLSKNPNNKPLYPNYQGRLAPTRTMLTKHLKLASYDNPVKKRLMT